MTNSEAISLIERLKAEIEWDLSLEYQTALDKAISSLKRDEIGLTDTVKEIHDGVYAEAYQQGRADAIEEYRRTLSDICCRDNYSSAYLLDLFNRIAEQLKEKG